MIFPMLEFEKEELDVKYESMTKENTKLEDQIEEVYTEKRELLKVNEKLSNDNSELKELIEKANFEIKNSIKFLMRK